MSQNLTNRYEESVKKIKVNINKPYKVVLHSRDEKGAYNGKTTCMISFIDKVGPRTIIGTALFNKTKEERPITKKQGYRIATERAYKKYLARVEK